MSPNNNKRNELVDTLFNLEKYEQMKKIIERHKKAVEAYRLEEKAKNEFADLMDGLENLNKRFPKLARIISKLPPTPPKTKKSPPTKSDSKKRKGKTLPSPLDKKRTIKSNPSKSKRIVYDVVYPDL